MKSYDPGYRESKFQGVRELGINRLLQERELVIVNFKVCFKNRLSVAKSVFDFASQVSVVVPVRELVLESVS